jgi:hypothetical protein
MPKSIPTLGLANWGQPLNEHLSQLNDSTNGGINKFDSFSQRPTTLTANDIGKTYLYTQTGNIHQWDGTNWKVLNESHINVKDFGAVGDGVSDDTAAIQLAINTAKGAGLKGISNKAVFIPGGIYIISSTLTVDSTFTSILSSGAILFSNGFVGTLLNIIASDPLAPYDQTGTRYEGFEIRGQLTGGTTLVAGSIAIKLSGGSGVSPINVASLTLAQINVQYFDKAIVFEDNVYLINFVNSTFFNLNTGVTLPKTYNGGERMTFHNCTFGNNTLAVSMNNDSADMMFTNCSFDYGAKIIDLVYGKIFLNDCHLEFGNPTGPQITLGSGLGTALVMKGGQILSSFTPSSAKNFDTFIDVQSQGGVLDQGGGALFDGVCLHNMDTKSGFFGSGDGPITVINSQTFQFTGFAPKAISVKENLLADGGFEDNSIGTLIDDIVFLENSTTNILNNGKLDLSTTTSTFKSGSNSLRINKPSSQSSGCSFIIGNRVRSGSRIGFKAFTKNDALLNGTLFYSIVFYKVNNNGTVPKLQKFVLGNSYNINFTGATSGTWSDISYPDCPKAPIWATHCGILFNLDSLSVGSIYFDEINIGMF